MGCHLSYVREKNEKNVSDNDQYCHASSITVNYSIYFTLPAVFYKLNVVTKVHYIIICIKISKIETRKCLKSTQQSDRLANPFSC